MKNKFVKGDTVDGTNKETFEALFEKKFQISDCMLQEIQWMEIDNRNKAMNKKDSTGVALSDAVSLFGSWM